MVIQQLVLQLFVGVRNSGDLLSNRSEIRVARPFEVHQESEYSVEMTPHHVAVQEPGDNLVFRGPEIRFEDRVAPPRRGVVGDPSPEHILYVRVRRADDRIGIDADTWLEP